MTGKIEKFEKSEHFSTYKTQNFDREIYQSLLKQKDALHNPRSLLNNLFLKTHKQNIILSFLKYSFTKGEHKSKALAVVKLEASNLLIGKITVKGIKKKKDVLIWVSEIIIKEFFPVYWEKINNKSLEKNSGNEIQKEKVMPKKNIDTKKINDNKNKKHVMAQKIRSNIIFKTKFQDQKAKQEFQKIKKSFEKNLFFTELAKNSKKIEKICLSPSSLKYLNLELSKTVKIKKEKDILLEMIKNSDGNEIYLLCDKKIFLTSKIMTDLVLNSKSDYENLYFQFKEHLSQI